MKKLMFLMALLPSVVFAQTDDKERSPKNELNVNAFEVIIGGVVPITYERFITNSQSLGLKAYILDKHYNDFNDNNSYNAFSLQAEYIIYFSEKKKNAGFYAYPSIKYTGGKYTNVAYIYDPKTETANLVKSENKLNAAILGFGLGYKFVWKDKITIGLGGDLGRVLNNAGYYNYYGPVDARFGINVGFRF